MDERMAISVQMLLPLMSVSTMSLYSVTLAPELIDPRDFRVNDGPCHFLPYLTNNYWTTIRDVLDC